ncbi:DNA adenine methylase [uncultured Draconibacterium sp.]|uniref:DNA adenine methylase n=1 Tax=uncultured Draconibacterium sp. TaxID=1573823 RepID=UPI003260CCC4
MITDKINLKVKSNKMSPPPPIIKYMGSKRELLKFVIDGIRSVHNGELICDLFAGSGVIGATLKDDAKIWSNDIQEYSEILSRTYLSQINQNKFQGILHQITRIAEEHVKSLKANLSSFRFIYKSGITLSEFQALEKNQQALINHSFDGQDFHLFTKYYSGTYWSFEQCVWIDAYRKAADFYAKESIYPLIISALMHAMAYNAQSTGHFAQYRDANKASSMMDILIYRRRNIQPYFEKKFSELLNYSTIHNKEHVFTSIDYMECLERIPDGSLVYADPPYNFVHYSRFYHAFETLVKYDYPEIAHKGRYRNERHQSPFCQRANVENAFKNLFTITSQKKLKLVLSYSNTGMINLQKVKEIAENSTEYYDIYIKERKYTHSTMGRAKDKSRNVNEILVFVVPK